MGDEADDALDRELNELFEDTFPLFLTGEVCPECRRLVDRCVCNEHPNEDGF